MTCLLTSRTADLLHIASRYTCITAHQFSKNLLTIFPCEHHPIIDDHSQNINVQLAMLWKVCLFYFGADKLPVSGPINFIYSTNEHACGHKAVHAEMLCAMPGWRRWHSEGAVCGRAQCARRRCLAAHPGGLHYCHQVCDTTRASLNCWMLSFHTGSSSAKICRHLVWMNSL